MASASGNTSNLVALPASVRADVKASNEFRQLQSWLQEHHLRLPRAIYSDTRPSQKDGVAVPPMHRSVRQQMTVCTTKVSFLSNNLSGAGCAS